jgi:AraC family transcriptional regulator
LAKIALALEHALDERRRLGESGRTESHILASGDEWSVADVVCTSGPQDHPFEEQHSSYSLAIVLSGSFQYRSASGCALMTPGSLLLGSPGQCFECGHEHAEGDRCVAFRFSPEYFDRLVSDAGHRSWRPPFRVPRIPPLRALAPVIAASGAGLTGTAEPAWDELAIQLVAGAVTAVRGAAPLYGTPVDAERRVTRIVRMIGRAPQAPFTLNRMARDAGLSPFHFLRTFERLTGVTPHQYILRTRLRQAAMRLASRADSVVDVALQCGFGDVSNFNRTFRAEFGLTPRTYRLRWR